MLEDMHTCYCHAVGVGSAWSVRLLLWGCSCQHVPHQHLLRLPMRPRGLLLLPKAPRSSSSLVLRAAELVPVGLQLRLRAPPAATAVARLREGHGNCCRC